MENDLHSMLVIAIDQAFVKNFFEVTSSSCTQIYLRSNPKALTVRYYASATAATFSRIATWFANLAKVSFPNIFFCHYWLDVLALNARYITSVSKL